LFPARERTKKGKFLNEAVSSPEMRDWLGKAVGSEAEDLSLNDKWLCPI